MYDANAWYERALKEPEKAFIAIACCPEHAGNGPDDQHCDIDRSFDAIIQAHGLTSVISPLNVSQTTIDGAKKRQVPA